MSTPLVTSSVRRKREKAFRTSSKWPPEPLWSRNANNPGFVAPYCSRANGGDETPIYRHAFRHAPRPPPTHTPTRRILIISRPLSRPITHPYHYTLSRSYVYHVTSTRLHDYNHLLMINTREPVTTSLYLTEHLARDNQGAYHAARIYNFLAYRKRFNLTLIFYYVEGLSGKLGSQTPPIIYPGR